jgi:hypothetical protein
VLPYLEQDDWGCERTPTNLSVVILENEYLRASITPQWGEKIWSVYNKKLVDVFLACALVHHSSSVWQLLVLHVYGCLCCMCTAACAACVRLLLHGVGCNDAVAWAVLISSAPRAKDKYVITICNGTLDQSLQF